MAVSQKRTHFGRAGEYFAMSELLLRGWNVAVPVVDVGDDVLIIDDNDKTTFRVQVKTSGVEGGSASFVLSRKQLRSPQAIELLYMLMLRDAERWHFLVIPRPRLDALRRRWLSAERTGPGRPPKPDAEATTDALTLTIALGDEPTAWGASLREFYEAWPDEVPVLETGPGTVGRP